MLTKVYLHCITEITFYLYTPNNFNFDRIFYSDFFQESIMKTLVAVFAVLLGCVFGQPYLEDMPLRPIDPIGPLPPFRPWPSKCTVVADPGFPVGGGGGAEPLGGTNLQCGHFLVKMYAKIKEFDPVAGGGGRRRHPLDQPMYSYNYIRSAGIFLK